MDTNTTPSVRVHQGHNVRKFREMLDIKQEFLAEAINISQQHLSRLEQSEVIDDRMLDKISEALNIPSAAIKNMSEEGMINIIANTFHDHSAAASMYLPHYEYFQCTFNPFDKIVELYERIIELERKRTPQQ